MGENVSSSRLLYVLPIFVKMLNFFFCYFSFLCELLLGVCQYAMKKINSVQNNRRNSLSNNEWESPRRVLSLELPPLRYAHARGPRLAPLSDCEELLRSTELESVALRSSSEEVVKSSVSLITLPSEILEHILSFCSAKSLDELPRVSRRLRTVLPLQRSHYWWRHWKDAVCGPQGIGSFIYDASSFPPSEQRCEVLNSNLPCGSLGEMGSLEFRSGIDQEDIRNLSSSSHLGQKGALLNSVKHSSRELTKANYFLVTTWMTPSETIIVGSSKRNLTSATNFSELKMFPIQLFPLAIWSRPMETLPDSVADYSHEPLRWVAKKHSEHLPQEDSLVNLCELFESFCPNPQDLELTSEVSNSEENELTLNWLAKLVKDGVLLSQVYSVPQILRRPNHAYAEFPSFKQRVNETREPSNIFVLIPSSPRKQWIRRCLHLADARRSTSAGISPDDSKCKEQKTHERMLSQTLSTSLLTPNHRESTIAPSIGLVVERRWCQWFYSSAVQYRSALLHFRMCEEKHLEILSSANDGDSKTLPYIESCRRQPSPPSQRWGRHSSISVALPSSVSSPPATSLSCLREGADYPSRFIPFSPLEHSGRGEGNGLSFTRQCPSITHSSADDWSTRESTGVSAPRSRQPPSRLPSLSVHSSEPMSPPRLASLHPVGTQLDGKVLRSISSTTNVYRRPSRRQPHSWSILHPSHEHVTVSKNTSFHSRQAPLCKIVHESVRQFWEDGYLRCFTQNGRSIHSERVARGPQGRALPEMSDSLAECEEASKNRVESEWSLYDWIYHVPIRQRHALLGAAYEEYMLSNDSEDEASWGGSMGESPRARNEGNPIPDRHSKVPLFPPCAGMLFPIAAPPLSESDGERKLEGIEAFAQHDDSISRVLTPENRPNYLVRTAYDGLVGKNCTRRLYFAQIMFEKSPFDFPSLSRFSQQSDEVSQEKSTREEEMRISQESTNNTALLLFSPSEIALYFALLRFTSITKLMEARDEREDRYVVKCSTVSPVDGKKNNLSFFYRYRHAGCPLLWMKMELLLTNDEVVALEEETALISKEDFFASSSNGAAFLGHSRPKLKKEKGTISDLDELEEMEAMILFQCGMGRVEVDVPPFVNFETFQVLLRALSLPPFFPLPLLWNYVVYASMISLKIWTDSGLTLFSTYHTSFTDVVWDYYRNKCEEKMKENRQLLEEDDGFIPVKEEQIVCCNDDVAAGESTSDTEDDTTISESFSSSISLFTMSDDSGSL